MVVDLSQESVHTLFRMASDPNIRLGTFYDLLGTNIPAVAFLLKYNLHITDDMREALHYKFQGVSFDVWEGSLMYSYRRKDRLSISEEDDAIILDYIIKERFPDECIICNKFLGGSGSPDLFRLCFPGGAEQHWSQRQLVFSVTMLLGVISKPTYFFVDNKYEVFYLAHCGVPIGGQKTVCSF